jgi:hypothetical protein
MNRKIAYCVAAGATATAILAVVAMSYYASVPSLKVLLMQNVTNVSNPSISINPETGMGILSSCIRSTMQKATPSAPSQR